MTNGMHWARALIGAAIVALSVTPSAQSARQATPAAPLVIAFLGDDLIAGDGLLSMQAVPYRVQALFQADGYAEVSVLDASASGETSAGGLRRIENVLQSGVRVVVVALGANDAIHGISPAQMHDNLAAIVTALEAKGVAVALVGADKPLASMALDDQYRAAFRSAFDRIAVEHKHVAYVPSLLEGVIGSTSLLQADGIHPNAEGARLVAQHLYPALRNVVSALVDSGPVR